MFLFNPVRCVTLGGATWEILWEGPRVIRTPYALFSTILDHVPFEKVTHRIKKKGPAGQKKGPYRLRPFYLEYGTFFLLKSLIPGKRSVERSY